MTVEQTGARQPRQYLIRDDEDAVVRAGMTHANEQVLIGTHPNCSLLAVFFDVDGRFLRVDSRGVRPATAQAAWTALGDWMEELGFTSQTLRVQRFFLDSERTGITDLPEFMHDYLELAPAAEDRGYRPGLYEDIEEFVRSEQYVLWWCGKEFWMSKDGNITDT